MALRHRVKQRSTGTDYLNDDIDNLVDEVAEADARGRANAPVVPAVVRSLEPVGGTRPSKRNMRRLNRIAREKGFATWAAFIHAMTVNQALFANIQKIAAAIQARQVAEAQQ